MLCQAFISICCVLFTLSKTPNKIPTKLSYKIKKHRKRYNDKRKDINIMRLSKNVLTKEQSTNLQIQKTKLNWENFLHTN